MAPRAFLLASICLAAFGQIHVAPSGRDDASGTADSPVATPGRALELARRNNESRIVFRGGVYRLTEAITLTAADSGRTLEAAPGEAVTLSGATPVAGWSVDDQGRWQVQIGATFTQLWVNGQRRYRPRLPKQGFYRIQSRVPSTAANTTRGADRFRYRAGDLRPDWRNFSDVEVLPFHRWTISRMRMRSLDEAARLVTFTGPSRCASDWCAYETGNRFLVENVAEALSEPGEWYLDRPSGRLTYIPIPGESVENTTVLYPRVERLLLLDGARDVTLRNLRFEHTNFVLPPEGYSSFQSEVQLGGAVTLRNTRNVVIEGCTVAHTGQHGVLLSGTTRETRIEGSTLFDLGAGGIQIGDPSRPTSEETVPGWNVIRNNLLQSGGRHHPAGCGILITHSPYNTVERNTIRDFYYTGVSVGWSWGYAASLAHHNVIRDNRIGQIGQGVLSDMGGIYTLGVSPGSELRRNFIYDISAFDYGGWGLYHDEGSTGYLTTENIVVNTKTGGFHQHYGRENNIVNNLLIDAAVQQIQKSRLEPHLQFTFERNVVVGRQNPMLGGGATSPQDVTFRNNLYWLGGVAPRFGPLSWEQWRAQGQDEGSVVADPGMSENYAFAEASPVHKIGFRMPDLSGIGSDLPDPADPASPRAFPYSQSGIEEIRESFEDTEPGDGPLDLTRREQGGAVATVVETQAASGRRSLEFRDPDGRADSFPHVYYQPKWSGAMNASFRVRLGEGAIFWHEWRTSGSPYIVGPSVRITDAGSLTALGSGTLTTGLPRNQWLTLAIEAKTGEGRYALTLRLPDGTERKWDNLPCSRDWSDLGWWGFVSSSSRAETSFWLDDVTLTRP